MEHKYNKSLIANAKSLRKNMTKEERHLWYDFLRFCPEAKLIIELDGSQHFEEKGIEYDEQRTAFLEEYGLTVIRIPNNMINKQFNAVCEYSDNYIKEMGVN